MNEQELAHVLRAAAKIAGDPRILVIGSQAILGTLPDSALPDAATRSVEADLVFIDDPDTRKADLIDGSIGEESTFHHTHGYYAQGVEMSTAVLPEGWEQRAVAFDRPDAQPAQAQCLEIYDIAVAKLVAGREKDYEYVGALLQAGLIDIAALLERCAMTPAPVRGRITERATRLAR